MAIPLSEATIITLAPLHWDEEAEVVVVGYGFAGATAAMAAHDAGAKVLLLEKALEIHKGGNSRVSANIVFWPDDVDKGKAYFRAIAGPFMDDIPEEMLDVWAREMFANRAWLEGLGMTPVEIPYVEFPDFAGAECVRFLLNGEGPIGGERLWNLIEASVEARHIDTRYETAVIHLVQEEREILGVIAERQGKRVAIRAHRGVVLTCGGFENNPAMIRNYVSGLPRVFPVGTPYNTGDGIRMADRGGTLRRRSSASMASRSVGFSRQVSSLDLLVSLPGRRQHRGVLRLWPGRRTQRGKSYI